MIRHVPTAAMKKMWAERREERLARISAGVRRYWDAVRQSSGELGGNEGDAITKPGTDPGTNRP